jgi:HSP20 family molecular chaperone IbpA
MRDIDDWINRIMKDFFGGDIDELPYGGYKYRDTYKKPQEPGVALFEKDVNIFYDDEHIYITADLKVPDEDMKVTPMENGILMEFMKEGSWRRRTLKIPRKANPSSAQITYVNGILDITLDIEEEEVEDEL